MTNKTTSRNRRQARALRDRADAESVVKRRRADRSATWPSTNKYKVTANHSPHGPSAECVTPPVPVTALASLRPTFKGAVLKRPATELRCPCRRNPASWSPHLHSPTKPAAHRRAPRVCHPRDSTSQFCLSTGALLVSPGRGALALRQPTRQSSSLPSAGCPLHCRGSIPARNSNTLRRSEHLPETNTWA